LSGFFVFVRAADGRGAGFFTGVHTVLFRSRCDICCDETRGLVPPIHTHHRPQAHPRRPRQPIPQRRHATVLAPLLLERQKLAPTKSTPATTHDATTSKPTTRPRASRPLRAVPAVEFPLAGHFPSRPSLPQLPCIRASVGIWTRRDRMDAHSGVHRFACGTDACGCRTVLHMPYRCVGPVYCVC